MKVELRYGETIRTVPWNVVIGLITARGIDSDALERGLGLAQETASLDTSQRRAQAMTRMDAFESFFTQNGFRCPLRDQFKSILEKGLPTGSPLVRALLLAEMSTGILMGAQDASAITGTLLCDLARGGEVFAGMRGEVLCSTGEIVLRDSRGIIATLLQGPDRRTRLKKDTRDVVFIVFSVPNIEVTDIQEAMQAVQALVTSACTEIESQLSVAATMSV